MLVLAGQALSNGRFLLACLRRWFLFSGIFWLDQKSVLRILDDVKSIHASNRIVSLFYGIIAFCLAATDLDLFGTI